MAYRIKGLKTFAKRMSLLGNVLPDSVQAAYDEVAVEAIKAMAPGFNASIEGGPVDYMAVKPGSTRSSILPSLAGRGAQRGVAESRIFVQRDQSAVFKYSLAGEDSREHGDVGAATKKNFAPQKDALVKYQGIKLTKQGNIPTNTLGRLITRAKALRGKREAAATARAALPEEERNRLGRSTGREMGSRDDFFYGQPTGKRGDVLGFWQRPEHRKGKLKLLISAVDTSAYRGESKVPEWNQGVEDAAKRGPKAMDDAIGKAVAKVRLAVR